ncbi:polysaccharide deacetylase family protein [Tellurirhabdus bombi]|uniref:hypothetical protein n=1 Tax=Tellurirhabdus bombi TaxID=2907205 RepID=UPI001F44C79F|nr:hypothetical protein [Tellurirhabdus bombi]
MDFTLPVFESLMRSLMKAEYVFQSFSDFIKAPADRAVVLRHDVDAKAANSLATAQLQARLQIRGVYYFRCVPQSFKPEIIAQIAELGHEIGYHYEDLTLAKGDPQSAIGHFTDWLNRLRAIYPVETICMHGSPLSRYDNRDLWQHYDYKHYGVLAEPYFDTDFTEVCYLTDTGRGWNRTSSSVRDKVVGYTPPPFANTQALIQWISSGQAPAKLMINFHPQRWTNNPLHWCQEYALQNLKNVAKQWLVAAPKSKRTSTDLSKPLLNHER